MRFRWAIEGAGMRVERDAELAPERGFVERHERPARTESIPAA
jgi:hypothetical protein